MTEKTEKARTVLEVRGVALHFRKKEVLKDISLDGKQGTCIGIVGPNGCGKSTLLSVLAGIRRPSAGSFRCFGHDMFHEKRFADFIAYVPQDNPLIEELTVQDNLRLWAGNGGFNRALLEKMQFTSLLQDKVSTISGGERRRLAIAAALGRRRPVLMMDEPTSSLDLHQKEIIHRCLQDYLAQKGTVVMSTHDAGEIRACDELYFIKDGRTSAADAEQVITWLREG